MQSENTFTNDTHANNREISHRRGIIKSFTARANSHSTKSEKIADWLTDTFGSMGFLVSNFFFFFVWLVLNLRIIPDLEPFDPFPFGLLTTIVSLEAIALAIFVLISQNRASRVADLREEIDLHIDIMAEKEITKILQLQKMILERSGIDLSADTELRDMLNGIDTHKVEKILEKDISKHRSYR